MNFYKSAAQALDHLDKHQTSVKGSISAAGIKLSPGETKRVLALTIQTLKYKAALKQLLDIVPVLQLEKLTFPRKVPRSTPSSLNLVFVLLHDLLFSPGGKIEASDKWPPKEAIMRHKSRLRAELVKLQIREGKSRKEDLGKTPGSGSGEARYVRWNPNIDLCREGDWSLEALTKHLKEKHGYQRGDAQWPIPSGTFFMDAHLPDCLLVFPGSANWWVGDKWYEAGAVILQDKASCFPAKVLMEGWEGEGNCLDATAAPGNKTSYVSALMGNTGSVIAFEKSKPRFGTLEKMLKTAGCTNVRARNADFLESDPSDEEFADVTRILLDPSCSGSGIVNRLDYLVENEVEESGKAERLEKLASFQLQMILHAFSFPAAQCVVYSTCSIHPEEDERVVMAALHSRPAKERGWTLAAKQEVLPTWPRRGRKDEMEGDQGLADRVVRCLPEDKTNGFFVSCFVRGATAPHEANGKRTRDDDDGDEEGSGGEDIAPGDQDEGTGTDAPTQPKTAAQLERARRKKQAQKAKKRLKVVPPSG